MKKTMKIKCKTNYTLPSIIKKGDWIDLYVAEDVTISGPYATTLHRKKDVETNKRDVVFDYKLISLGVAMKLPSGFEAMVLPRSSTFRNFGITLVNSEGVIDESFSGNDDIWKFGALAFKDTTIPSGARIAQFRIQLSQKANFWQKLRWLLSSRIKIVKVDNLSDVNRGGIGSTGK